jgi:hypothetical protein
MKLHWVDMTDYSGAPAPVEGKTKPRATLYSVLAGPLTITVSRAHPDFPNAWAYEIAPLFPFVSMQLPAWADPEQAMERAAARTRQAVEACLMYLPK